MKKFLFLIPLLILFLPFNVNADSLVGFSPALTGYTNGSGTSYSSCNGSDFRCVIWSGAGATTYTKTFSLSTAYGYTTGRFDYFLVNLTTSNVNAKYIVDGLENYSVMENSTAINVMAYQVRGSETLKVPCYSLGQSGGNDTIFNLYCPVIYNSTSLTKFEVTIITGGYGNTNYTFQVGMGTWLSFHNIGFSSQDIVNAQQATTNAINSVNSTLNDDSTSSSQSSTNNFFSNFSVNNHGLTGVVLAPVNFIQSFTNTCQPVTLTLFNKEVPIPCGDTIFWGKSDTRISNFRNIWNVLVGGPIIYALLLSIYRSIHKAMDPDKNEEGGLDL